MAKIKISDKIMRKLIESHSVREREVEECFENKDGPMFLDTAEDHQTDPPTLWFISETNSGRLLAIYCMLSDGYVHIKTAFPPGQGRIDQYELLRASS